ncbi:MAG: glycosyl transferase [Candidatus Omnitrophica bacterium 4484_213]|nr:MAG: glycosyl transferase [Candidatus Omnitrophica bacterium 4484_213]
MKQKRIAILSPAAWRTPPRTYGAWETVASNITEGLVERGWDVTLFATRDSITKAKLEAVIEKGYEEDKSVNPDVYRSLHISHLFEKADEFDLIHNHYDFFPLTYSRLVSTPMLTTIHGFSSPTIMPVYQKYKDSYFVSISDADRAPGLNYLATVYNGIRLADFTFYEKGGENLIFLGRIHPDKGVDLAIAVAQRSRRPLIIAGIIQDKDYFKQKVKPFIDSKLIKFIGPVGPKERNELFKDAYALLHLNTIPERFGLVLVEAMACGVPVIAMDLGSCREVILDGKTGILIRPVKSAKGGIRRGELFNRVKVVNEAVAALDKIPFISREECRKRVEKFFTVECMVEKYEKVYEKIFTLHASRSRLHANKE